MCSAVSTPTVNFENCTFSSKFYFEMSTLGYRQGSGEAIPAIIHPSYVAGGQTWAVLSGVKKDVLNTVFQCKRIVLTRPGAGRVWRSCKAPLSLFLRVSGLRTVCSHTNARNRLPDGPTTQGRAQAVVRMNLGLRSDGEFGVCSEDRR